MTNYFLKSEYSNSKKLLTSNYFSILFGFLSGFSVFYFLYFFEAYDIQKGLSYSGHSHLFRSISYGVLIFIYLAVFENWLKPALTATRFSYGAAWYSGLVILGSHFIFLLFNFFWNWEEWNLEAYGLIMKELPLMMVLPWALYLAFRAILKPKTSEEDYLSFRSENGKDLLKVKLQKFLFAKSSENYITISSISNGQLEQHLIRKPLKVLEQELKANPDIGRTHRNYLVNKRNIQAVQQGKGTVHLEVNGARVPVSKQFWHHYLDRKSTTRP